MGRFKNWIVDQLPLLDLFPKRTGNELRSKNGGTILGTPFESQETENKLHLPVPWSQERHGLGDLGMKVLRDTTFKSSGISAGERPVLVQGIPSIT